jgi:hypothetical protein
LFNAFCKASELHLELHRFFQGSLAMVQLISCLK